MSKKTLLCKNTGVIYSGIGKEVRMLKFSNAPTIIPAILKKEVKCIRLGELIVLNSGTKVDMDIQTHICFAMNLHIQLEVDDYNIVMN